MTEPSAPSPVVMRSYDLLTDEWQSWPTLKAQGANYDHLSELHFHWHMADWRMVEVGRYAGEGSRWQNERSYKYYRRGSGHIVHETRAYYEDKDYD